MYGNPTTLFAAEFMGSNNRLHGKYRLEDGRARIEGASWALWGMAASGQRREEATAVIRVERLRLGATPG
jgi:iron(III) transport system ATP-binding protein